MQVMGLNCNDPEWFFNVIADWARIEDIPIDLFVDGCMAMKGNASSLDMQRQLFEVKATFDMISRTGLEQRQQIDCVLEKLHGAVTTTTSTTTMTHPRTQQRRPLENELPGAEEL